MWFGIFHGFNSLDSKRCMLPLEPRNKRGNNFDYVHVVLLKCRTKHINICSVNSSLQILQSAVT